MLGKPDKSVAPNPIRILSLGFPQTKKRGGGAMQGGEEDGAPLGDPWIQSDPQETETNHGKQKKRLIGDYLVNRGILAPTNLKDAVLVTP